MLFSSSPLTQPVARLARPLLTSSVVMCAALMLFPAAAAEGEVVLSVDGDLVPFTFVEQRATVLVDVDCGVFAGVPPEIVVELTLDDVPGWLEAFLEEPELRTSPTSCPGSRTTLQTELRLFWKPSDVVPTAGEPYAFQIRAQTEDLRGNVFESMASVQVRAGLRGTMRVVPGEWPQVTPGQLAQFTLDVVNDYNAHVGVDFVPTAETSGYFVHAVAKTVPPHSRTAFVFSARIPSDLEPTDVVELALPWNATHNGSVLHAGVANVSLAVVPSSFYDRPPGDPPSAATPAADRPASTPAPTPPDDDAIGTPGAGSLGILGAGLAAAWTTRRRAPRRP